MASTSTRNVSVPELQADLPLPDGEQLVLAEERLLRPWVVNGNSRSDVAYSLARTLTDAANDEAVGHAISTDADEVSRAVLMG